MRTPSPYRAQWRELGGFGRVLIISVAVATGLAIALSFWIPWQVERTLIDERSETFSRIAAELAGRDLIPTENPTQDELSELGEVVGLELLGGDAVRVKFWSREGRIIFSDEPLLIGRQFPHDEERERAFAGEIVTMTPDVTEPENLFERGLGTLREYYVPIYGTGGEVDVVFGVYEDAERLDSAVSSTRRNVWLSMGIALLILLGAIVSLTVANARIITRRARHAEALADELARVREDERKRIVGALHDDIGQPLYRVLYGVQGARALTDDEKVDAELAGLEELLHRIDGDLRSELKQLHDETLHQVSLADLLEDLASRAEKQTTLTVDVDLQGPGRLPGVMRSALYRAAREAVTNAWKHADASRVTMSLRNGDGQAILEVHDDGKGMMGAVPGIGLSTTRQRLETIGGGIDVRSTERGTVLRAWVPIP